MKLQQLIIQNIRHYRRANLWLAIAVAITTAVITGGLIVGDSVSYSLQKTVELRLGKITHTLHSSERYFTLNMQDELMEKGLPSSAALQIEGNASSEGGQLKLNSVQVWGLDNAFPKVSGIQEDFLDSTNEIAVSANMAARLNLEVGDQFLLKVKKASLIPANAPFVSDEDQYMSLRSTVHEIVHDENLGRLNLRNSQTAPFNVFMPLPRLNQLMDFNQRANILFFSAEQTEAEIKQHINQAYTLSDLSLKLQEAATSGDWELKSERVFMGKSIEEAILEMDLEHTPILTYFVNRFSHENRATPYSFISSVKNEELGDNEIIVNEWLADDLQLDPGDSLKLAYFEMGPLRTLTEKDTVFVVRKIVPIEGYFSDKSLMPDIPGLSDSESCRDWDTGIPVDLRTIRDKDEEYWYQYRGLPKAFVSYSTAKALWQNRFGNATAYRFNALEIDKKLLEERLLEKISPFALGFVLQDVRTNGQYAANNGTDFTELFLGLSFFILASGILLIALLFNLSLEKRISEIGTYSALGFTRGKTMQLFMIESLMVAAGGAALGIVLALGYNQLIFEALNRIWNEIVRTDVLVPVYKASSLAVGFFISLFVAGLTLFFGIRKKLKQQTASIQRKGSPLLSETRRKIITYSSVATLLCALCMLACELLSKQNQSSGSFFIAGGLLLVSLLGFIYGLLYHENRTVRSLKMSRLLMQNLRRNRKRNLSIVMLLAIGTFLVVSTGLNRKNIFSKANEKSSGTGGFLFWVETTLPVLHNLNNNDYRGEQGFMSDFEAVQFRIAEGDDASCLNLNRISNPRILGLDADNLSGRFSIQTSIQGIDDDNFWAALKSDCDDCIPAIADQTVIQWSLGKKVGDTLVYRNSMGEEIKLLLIAGLKASVFQGNVIIDQDYFLKNFPTSSGSGVMLIDGEAEQQEAIADELELVYRDLGIQITPTAQRLAEFLTVNNTYLSIFLVLGALGLLIGTIGLAIILQQSLLERKNEFALLLSLGFKESSIFKLVSREYILMLIAGMLIGFGSAFIAVFPSINKQLQDLSMGFVAGLMLLIMVNGLIWIFVLSRWSLKKMNLVEALRNE